MMIDNNPLVSIIVFTYNSSVFVLETLESAKSQSYKNIELIVSDDGSKDDTVEVCENWLKENKDRFTNTHIISVKENTGVSSNCIRATKSFSGEWVKMIAGDDILAPNCIEVLTEICIKSDFKVLFSDLKCFTNDKQYDYPHFKEVREHFFSLTLEQKYEYFLIDPFFLNLPSIFLHRTVFSMPNLFNEKYWLLEDQPMMYNILKNKIDIHYAKVQVVFYRMHESSITGKINPAFQKALYECYKEYRKPNIKNSFKGILFKRMTELTFYINIHFSDLSFKDRSVRKLHEIFKNSLKPFLKY